MKVLLLTKYDELAASSRLRSIQYLPYLRSQGIEVTVSPLFGKEYVTELYATHRKPLRRAVAGYCRRILTLVTARKYDVIWIEKEVFPYVPWFIEKLCMMKMPYVVDYDDAIFHLYDQSKNPLVAAMLSDKIAHVMRNSKAVLAGNDYIIAKARHSCAWQTNSLPTVVDLERYTSEDIPHAGFVIGWIGTPYTSRYLAEICDELASFCTSTGASILAVGADPDHLAGLPAEVVAWSSDTEADCIRRMDVGIMPLPSKPFEMGKCGYKIVQYFACGKPVVASAVGVNRKIVCHGKNGFLVEAPGDWSRYLHALMDDARARKEMGAAGRQLVEAEYNLAVTAPRLRDVLTFVAASKR